jgi:hypothetical protein
MSIPLMPLYTTPMPLRESTQWSLTEGSSHPPMRFGTLKVE